MTDLNTAINNDYFTVEAAAEHTQRHPSVIRTMIQNGAIAPEHVIVDPTDRRRKLISFAGLLDVMRRPRRGYVKKTIIATQGDRTIRITAAVKKEG